MDGGGWVGSHDDARGCRRVAATAASSGDDAGDDGEGEKAAGSGKGKGAEVGRGGGCGEEPSTSASFDDDDYDYPEPSSSTSSSSSSRMTATPPPGSSASTSSADAIAAATGELPSDLNAAAAGESRDVGPGTDVDERVELPPDTIAPMPEWMYPRRMDVVPALFGRLNPLTGILVYYTGAVLRECYGAPAVAVQWLLFVFAPSLAALASLRVLMHRRRVKRAVERAAERGEPPPPPQYDFLRANRPAWLDIHLGYAILLPAGATGGEGASWWLLLAPAFMLLRWLGHGLSFLVPVRRVVAVLGGVLALGALLMSASGALTQALSGLRDGGAAAYALAPVAFALTYFFYLAPAALLPGAIARAWRGEGFNKPRKKPKKASWLRRRLGDNKAGGEGPGGAMTPEDAAEMEKAEAEEKRQKRVWFAIGTAAMVVSMATGSDVPIFLCFFAQLFKADPSQLLQVMIDKGDPSRAEMDQKLADKVGSFFKRKEGKETDGDGEVSAKDAEAVKDTKEARGKETDGENSAGAGRTPA